MRRILVERARRRSRQIHGGGMRRQSLQPELVAATPSGPDDDLIALDATLAKLAQRDPQKARLVELRFFAGLTGEQAAEMLGISARTADRYWVYARAWLRREMERAGQVEENPQKPDADDGSPSH